MNNMLPIRKAVLMTTEQAKSLYQKYNSFRGTLLSEFTDEELGITPKMKSWEELKYLTGYWRDDMGEVVHENTNIPCIQAHKGLYATEKQMNSAFAMAQLSQLMKDLGDECDVDWEDGKTKYTIYRSSNSIIRDYTAMKIYYFLAFKTESVRDAFLEKHEKLINQFFML